MKILHFQAGLGNQMFQFAFYRYLESLGFTDIRFDTSSPSLSHHNGFELKQVFPAIASLDNFMPAIAARPLFLLGDISKKVFKKDLSTDCGNIADPRIPRGKIWLRGFWQEYAFVDHVREQLLSDFTFLPFNEEYNLAYAGQITSSQSVSLHVRLGDYLKPSQRISFGDICSPEYYREAISQIQSRIDHPVFFVFSDRISWVRQNLNLPNETVYIEGNSGKSSFRDMQLMSLCKHNIIANSSFSWWGAWLNQNPDKIVIAPSKWINNSTDVSARSMIPPSWTRIGVIRPNVSLILKDPEDTTEIQFVLQQSYIDFEIIVQEYPGLNDPRIVVNSIPSGNHIFEIDKTELKRFRDKRYLKNKLKQYFKCIHQT